MVGGELMPWTGATRIRGDTSKSTWTFPALHMEKNGMCIQWEVPYAQKFPDPEATSSSDNFYRDKRDGHK